MEKPFTYKILIPHKTIVSYYYGDISIDDLINCKTQMSEDKDYNPNYNLLLDFRNCNLNFSKASVIKHVEFVQNNKKIRADRFTVFLTEKPNEVVLTKLFEMLKGDLPIKTAIFTTPKAAVNWLFNSFDNLALFENTIENLKTSFSIKFM